MRIHRLIPIIAVLAVLAITTMSTIQHRLIGAGSGTVAAQKAIEAEIIPTQGDGISSVVAAETTESKEVDLYLDADEVERQALAEQGGSPPTNKLALSFKAVPIPLPGGIDHAVAGVATRNSGQGVIRVRGVPPGSTLLSAVLVWGEITPPPGAPYNVIFGPDCALGASFLGQAFPAGPAPQPCWNPAGQFFAYIANVTSQISAGINGDYRVRNLRSALTNNRCPW